MSKEETCNPAKNCHLWDRTPTPRPKTKCRCGEKEWGIKLAPTWVREWIEYFDERLCLLEIGEKVRRVEENDPMQITKLERELERVKKALTTFGINL